MIWKWVTIRYSTICNGSGVKKTSIRFKANALKGLHRLLAPILATKDILQSKTLVSFEFSTISLNERDKYSLLHTFVESDSYYKDIPNFVEMFFHFKTKYLKPCIGSKPNTYTVLSFP